MGRKFILGPYFINLLSIVLISCLGIIVYSNTFHCSYHLDDFFSITGNYIIKDISDLQGIWDYWPCRFITYLSIAFNYHFGQFDISGYHLFNLVVHLISAVLVWWLTRLTLSTPVMKGNKIAGHANLVALFVGLVFVSHPIQTQAVTYIIQRAASMMAMFYIASLCFYVKSRNVMNRDAINGVSTVLYYICFLITASLAMFTKETAITLPLMILLYEFYFFNLGKEAIKGVSAIRLAPFFLTILIIPLTMFLTKTVNFQGMHRASEDAQGISSLHYLLTQFRVIVTYVRLLFIPLHQNVDYDYPISHSLFELPALFSFLFLALILFFAQRSFLKYRLISFSILWFFLALLPESSFIPIKDVIFEHRLYLPMVGFSMFLVSGVYYVFCRHSEPEERRILRHLKILRFAQDDNGFRMTVVVLMMIIGCYSFLTYQRNKIWKDEYTLWSDTISKSPHKSRAYDNRGKFYLDQGKFALAMVDFNKAIESDPKDALSYNNLGCIYGKQGDFTHALMDFNKSIKIDPKNPFAYFDRSFVYYQEDKLNEAMLDVNKSIKINTNYADAYDNRGLIYNKEGLFTQALKDYNKAIELNPAFGEAYDNRGVIYFNLGHLSQALSDYNMAIRLNPDYASTYNDEGTLYEKQNDLIQAKADYTKAITLDPKLTVSYYNRGNVYYRSGHFTQAVADYTKAIELTPSFAQAYNNRGNACKQLGNQTQALADFNMAIERKPDYAAAYFSRGLIYYKENKVSEAVSDFTKVIEFDPASEEAYNDRGFVYASQGNLSQALSDYNKALELNPKFETANSNRAMLYLRLKEYDQEK